MDAATYRRLWKESQDTGRPIGQLIAEVEKSQEKSATTRSTGRNGHPEADLQKRCVAWFKNNYPDIAANLFHPNNEPYFGSRGRDRAAIDGHLANLMGVTKGVADLILLVPSADGKFHGLCIEMKSARGVQRDSQKEWQQAVERVGYKYVIVKDYDKFTSIIREFLQEP